MVCATCLALEFAPEDQLRRLVFWQAQQIHRLTGGVYEEPDFDALDEDFAEEEEVEPAPDAVFVVESLLGHDDIFRKPPRAAAPRLVDRLAAAGLYLTRKEP